jgi:hypothetical protein
MSIWHSWKNFLEAQGIVVVVGGFSYYLGSLPFIFNLSVLKYCSVRASCTPGLPCSDLIYQASCVAPVLNFIFGFAVFIFLFNIVGFAWFGIIDFIKGAAKKNN